MTVVFSNTGDVDTRVLSALWEGIPDARVLDVRPGTPDARRAVDVAIAEEEDALVLCGHGSPRGLFDPSAMARGDLLAIARNPPYLVDARNAPSIRARRVVGVWCYAAAFAESAGLRGFFTGMFVSNPKEASFVGCPGRDSAATITEQEVLFCRRVNELLRAGTPPSEWIPRLNAQADRSLGVVRYNYDRLRFFRS
ncbi:MAG: hypothetical protein IJL06_02185 [Kiritimatiellae bacterium]|nr:hypothetical protein [Kiritimatiellia bacterium]